MKIKNMVCYIYVYLPVPINGKFTFHSFEAIFSFIMHQAIILNHYLYRINLGG